MGKAELRCQPRVLAEASAQGGGTLAGLFDPLGSGMSYRMKPWQSSIIGGVAGAGGFIALLWLLSLSQTLKWIEAHEGLAGWLQAIFSVAAIGVTGWALIRQERRQEVIGRIDRYTARSDQLESLTAISGRLEALISDVRFYSSYILDEHDDDDWSAIADALSRVPVHEARDPEIAGAL